MLKKWPNSILDIRRVPGYVVPLFWQQLASFSPEELWASQRLQCRGRPAIRWLRGPGWPSGRGRWWRWRWRGWSTWWRGERWYWASCGNLSSKRDILDWLKLLKCKLFFSSSSKSGQQLKWSNSARILSSGSPIQWGWERARSLVDLDTRL